VEPVIVPPSGTAAGDLGGVTIAGRYRIISQVGAGGMGVAYRAWDVVRGLPVVVKIPKKSLQDDPNFSERFAREIRTVQGISHPHVVPIMDVGEHEGLPFVVMRFLPGGSLGQRRLRDEQGRPKANPPGLLHLWLPQVAAALDHVHAVGVVHRDVKPENIFFDARWGAFLGDFGIAKVVADSEGGRRDQTLTATSMAIGTPHYMAPEQFLPKAVVDGRTDQYALAVTVYEVLSGERPFRGEASNLIVEIMTAPPPPLVGRQRGLPPSLVAAVHQGLSKQPEQRFDSCREFAAAVLEDVARLPDEPDIARLLCPRCGRIIKLRPDVAGKNGNCPKCRAPMRVARDLESLWLLGEDEDQEHVAPRRRWPVSLLVGGMLVAGLATAMLAGGRRGPPPAVQTPDSNALPIVVVPPEPSQEAEAGEPTTDHPPPVQPAADPLAGARAALDRDPRDPVALGILGRHHCFAEERWDQGLEHLAYGDTPALATIARDELAVWSRPGDSRPGEVLRIAKAWWDLKAGGFLPRPEAEAVGRHAVELYERIVDQLMRQQDVAAANAWLDGDQAFRSLVGNVRPRPSPPPLPADDMIAKPVNPLGAPEPAAAVAAERPANPPADPPPRAVDARAILAEPPLENSIGIELKRLPPGSFLRGSNNGDPDEMPVHEVRITKPFHLGVHEVTNAQWQKIMGRVPSAWRGNEHPVEQVSWDDAVEFCRVLSAVPAERAAGRIYRLPTEAEWEYACRAGTGSDFAFGDDRSLLADHGWFSGNSGARTQPVGRKKPNAWGLHDMHGNVWEWCADGYGPYSSGVVTDPTGWATAPVKVVRGGNWGYMFRECRSAKRRSIDPGHRDHYHGFRVAMDERQGDRVGGRGGAYHGEPDERD